MVARPGMTNEEYNQMLKDQKASRARGKKVKLRDDHISWASVAQEVYGDQRWAEELARMNPNARFFSRGMTLKLPGKDKNPFISKSFLEGRSPYSLPGSDRTPLTTTAVDGTRTAATTTAAGPQPGFAQQRQPTGAYLDRPQQGLAGMERLPLEQSDVYAVLYRGMLPGTAARTDVDRGRLATLGRQNAPGQTQLYPGRYRARDARQRSAMLGSQPQTQIYPGEALPEAARITGPAQEFMQTPANIRRMQANQRLITQPVDDYVNRTYPSVQPTSRAHNVPETLEALGVGRAAQRGDFQAPAYQNSEEIVTQFMRQHPEILEGDFSNVDLDQLAVLMNYGYVDVYSGTSAASTGATGGAAAAGYYGRGRGGGGGGTRYYGGGGTRYGNSYQRREPVYIGLVKWRI